MENGQMEVLIHMMIRLHSGLLVNLTFLSELLLLSKQVLTVLACIKSIII